MILYAGITFLSWYIISIHTLPTSLVTATMATGKSAIERLLVDYGLAAAAIRPTLTLPLLLYAGVHRVRTGGRRRGQRYCTALHPLVRPVAAAGYQGGGKRRHKGAYVIAIQECNFNTKDIFYTSSCILLLTLDYFLGSSVLHQHYLVVFYCERVAGKYFMQYY